MQRSNIFIAKEKKLFIWKYTNLFDLLRERGEKKACLSST